MNDRAVFRFFLAVMLPGLAISMATTAHADMAFAVDSIVDQVDDDITDGLCRTSANTCSLRAAIMQANFTNLDTTITVPAGHYVLTLPPANGNGDDTGDLTLTTAEIGFPTIRLVGAGAATTVIDANQIDRVLSVHEGLHAKLSGFTLKNGSPDSATDIDGGAISAKGWLSIDNCVIENNTTRGRGGGIYAEVYLDVVASTIRSNAAFFGGGFSLTRGVATVRDSTIHDNAAETGGGAELDQDAQLEAINSTFSQNYANFNGGGIASDATIELYNSSVIGNDADHDRDENGGIGGGIYAINADFTGVRNSLIANNTIFSSPIADNCKGQLFSQGMNLLDEREGCTTATSESTLGFVSLHTIGVLQDNGGPTLTHALLAGSEAIDGTIAGFPCIVRNAIPAIPLATDQRGAARVAGTRCDVGAFEYDSVFDSIFADGFQ